MKSWQAVVSFLLIVLVTMLAGCGGGDSSSATNNLPATAHTLSGVAPSWLTVYLKDSSTPSKELSVTVNSDNSFSFDTTGITFPCLLKASASWQGSADLYSFATTEGTANINPLSNLAVLKANGDADLAALYATPDPAKMKAIAAGLPQVVAGLQTTLKGTLSQFSVAKVNFIADPYAANLQGLDLMFALIEITIDHGTVVFTDKTTSEQATSSLTNVLTDSITLTPLTPNKNVGAICVMPAAVTVAAGETVYFSGVVIGKPHQPVFWSVAGNNSETITSYGVFNPLTAGTYVVTASTSSGASTPVQVTVSSTSPVPFTFPDKVVSVTAAGGVAVSDKVTITGNNAARWPLSYTDSWNDGSDLIINNWYYLHGSALPLLRSGDTLQIVQSMPAALIVGGTCVTTVTVGGYTTQFKTMVERP